MVAGRLQPKTERDMKLHFEPNLDYQLQAVEAVCDLFRGQEVCRTEFTVTMRAPTAAPAGDLFPGTAPRQLTLGMAESDLGIGNRLTLLDDELLKNLNAIQLRNGLPPSEKLTSGDFTVEMETGTGKTYVYLRTIFELNKRYGFTKFVIVVPSVAIVMSIGQNPRSNQVTLDHGIALAVAVHRRNRADSGPRTVRGFQGFQNPLRRFLRERRLIPVKPHALWTLLDADRGLT